MLVFKSKQGVALGTIVLLHHFKKTLKEYKRLQKSLLQMTNNENIRLYVIDYFRKRVSVACLVVDSS